MSSASKAWLSRYLSFPLQYRNPSTANYYGQNRSQDISDSQNTDLNEHWTQITRPAQPPKPVNAEATFWSRHPPPLHISQDELGNLQYTFQNDQGTSSLDPYPAWIRGLSSSQFTGRGQYHISQGFQPYNPYGNSAERQHSFKTSQSDNGQATQDVSGQAPRQQANTLPGAQGVTRQHRQTQVTRQSSESQRATANRYASSQLGHSLKSRRNVASAEPCEYRSAIAVPIDEVTNAISKKRKLTAMDLSDLSGQGKPNKSKYRPPRLAKENAKAVSRDHWGNMPQQISAHADIARKTKFSKKQDRPYRDLLPHPLPAQDYMERAMSGIEEISTVRSLQNNPLLVILDLNGTLLHRAKSAVFVPRPGLSNFLRYLMSNHRVMVWSSARPENVHRMVENLEWDASQLVDVWARDSFNLDADLYDARLQVYKRLDWVWQNETVKTKQWRPDVPWDQTNTVLVDDSYLKALSHPHNLIEVPTFDRANVPTEETIRVLTQVKGYLEILRTQQNVSAYIRKNPFECTMESNVGYSSEHSDTLGLLPKSKPEPLPEP